MDVNFDGGISYSVQSNASSFYVAVGTNTQPAVTLGLTELSYTLTTGSPYQAQLISIATEEDLSDIKASDEALLEARTRGTRAWRQIRK